MAPKPAGAGSRLRYEAALLAQESAAAGANENGRCVPRCCPCDAAATSRLPVCLTAGCQYECTLVTPKPSLYSPAMLAKLGYACQALPAHDGCRVRNCATARGLMCGASTSDLGADAGTCPTLNPEPFRLRRHAPVDYSESRKRPPPAPDGPVVPKRPRSARASEVRGFRIQTPTVNDTMGPAFGAGQ